MVHIAVFTVYNDSCLFYHAFPCSSNNKVPLSLDFVLKQSYCPFYSDGCVMDAVMLLCGQKYISYCIPAFSHHSSQSRVPLRWAVYCSPITLCERTKSLSPKASLCMCSEPTSTICSLYIDQPMRIHQQPRGWFPSTWLGRKKGIPHSSKLKWISRVRVLRFCLDTYSCTLTNNIQTLLIDITLEL